MDEEEKSRFDYYSFFLLLLFVIVIKRASWGLLEMERGHA